MKKLEFKVEVGSHIRSWSWKELNVHALVQPIHVELVEREIENFFKIAKKYLDKKRCNNEIFDPAFCYQLLRFLEAIGKAPAWYPEFNFMHRRVQGGYSLDCVWTRHSCF